MFLQRGAFKACGLVFLSVLLIVKIQLADAYVFGNNPSREEIKLDTGWRFLRSENNSDGIVYDHRPDTPRTAEVLKPWILPSGNDFINDPASKHERPVSGSPGGYIPYVKEFFDDSNWQSVTLPHDWAIEGPFYVGDDPKIDGPMGRLPIHGVGWYRRRLTKTEDDEGKSIYLEIEGAYSYTMVWLNEQLVGGWPFGYNSFRLDLTPYLKVGEDNMLSIRLDNPIDSSRFYSGGGIYRDIWLTKVPAVQVGQYGTFITTKDVSDSSATIDLAVDIENKAKADSKIEVATTIHILDPATGRAADKVSEFPRQTVNMRTGQKTSLSSSVTLNDPRLWGPGPDQTPNLYVAVTRLYNTQDTFIDTYQTSFGIRNVTFDANNGLLVNGRHTYIQGVNQHHDLGALGAAFNARAAERQLEMLQELGCNAIRMAHNPPAAALLDLTDRMGFLVIDEIFDMWERNKTTNDFHLIFEDWHEPDLRAFIRRDRNHPSVISWSYGNEVREQDSVKGGRGVEISQTLLDIVHEEDSTRPASVSQCCVGPDAPFAEVPDIINLNYRGEGIGDTPPYADNQTSASTHPEYPDFHARFPEKLLLGSEYGASLSTRGIYTFPVTNETSAPVSDTSGGNQTSRYISSYELYTTDAGSSPDKVFTVQDKNPYVAGGFIWSGWDYVGEPQPYLLSRSASFGIIDLAGFKKDAFFLYQSRWRPTLRMAHILPHWTWPERIGMVTPVHVFSAADEAELFLNGRSQGRLKRDPYMYRFRWDEVIYEPGELRVSTYKDGEAWAEDVVEETAGTASKLELTADRTAITGDGIDLSFLSVTVTDSAGRRSPRANDAISFSISGCGQIVATDNGDSTDMTVFQSPTRNAFNGHALVIVRAQPGTSGSFTVTATAPGLESAQMTIEAQ